MDWKKLNKAILISLAVIGSLALVCVCASYNEVLGVIALFIYMFIAFVIFLYFVL